MTPAEFGRNGAKKRWAMAGREQRRCVADAKARYQQLRDAKLDLAMVHLWKAVEALGLKPMRLPDQRLLTSPRARFDKCPTSAEALKELDQEWAILQENYPASPENKD